MCNESSNQTKDQMLEAIKNGNSEFVKIKLGELMITHAIEYLKEVFYSYFL
jgi:hypothetical protein